MTQPTDHRHIRTTIARFLDGETSVAEEKELYNFFRLPDIPADLKQYQPMFNWYASLGDSHDEAAPLTSPELKTVRQPPACDFWNSVHGNGWV